MTGRSCSPIPCPSHRPEARSPGGTGGQRHEAAGSCTREAENGWGNHRRCPPTPCERRGVVMTTFKNRLLGGLALSTALAVGAALPAAADVELTMYYPIAVGGPLTGVVDGLVADFESEHPDIKVNAIYAGNYDDTRVRALAALNAGEPAQLSVLFSIDVFELLEQDVIVSFDDLVETEEDQEWLDSFYPGLMANGVVDGKTWGIPFQRSTIVMYWNKDAFAEAGLDPVVTPSTWGEMVEMGEALTKEDVSKRSMMV